jgi:hypothetical protein
MNQFVLGLLKYLSSRRHKNRNVKAIFAMTFIPFAMPATLCFEDPLVLKVQQRIDPVGALDEDIAAFASVASAWTTLWDKLLPSECKASIPSISGNNLYFCTIDEQRWGSSASFA